MGYNPERSLAEAKRFSRTMSSLHTKPGGRERWGEYDSSIASYENNFSPLLHGQHIVDLVADKPYPVVIDLMASTTALVDLFRQMPHRRGFGIAVSLGDNRRPDEIKRDNTLGIVQLKLDLTYAAEWDKLEAALGGRKADLVLARPIIAVDNFPRHERFYRFALGKAWSFLGRRKSHILTEIPSAEMVAQVGLPPLASWVEGVRGQGIEAESFIEWRRQGLKLVKGPHSPHVLPYR